MLATMTSSPQRIDIPLAHRPVEMVGASAAMRALHQRILRVGRSSRPVLVVGPTGCGKEVCAAAIHRAGASPRAPLVDVNCGALPGGLAESQLFGHERGSFTGADRYQPGFFEAVGDGTLFFDEIGELPLGQQVTLLRVLETGRFRPLGAHADLPFRGRVVAATHRDLSALVIKGAFREDLFFRLNVLVLAVPALVERREDIPALLAHFAGCQPVPVRFTSEAVEALVRAPWPGNVRQLRNVVDRLAVFAEGELVTLDLLRATGALDPVASQAEPLERLARSILALSFPDKLGAIERALVSEALQRADGNKSAAARLLGIDRKAFERRLQREQVPTDSRRATPTVGGPQPSGGCA
jgi:DNA-binding NtrC family response regulator